MSSAKNSTRRSRFLLYTDEEEDVEYYVKHFVRSEYLLCLTVPTTRRERREREKERRKKKRDTQSARTNS